MVVLKMKICAAFSEYKKKVGMLVSSEFEDPISVMLIFCMEIELSKLCEKKPKIKPFIIEYGLSPSQTL